MHDTADLSRALQLARAGRHSAALEILGAVLTRTPGEPEALHLTGMVLRAQGRLTEAEQCLRRSLLAAPARAHVHNNLGNLLAQQRRNAEAIDSYRQAIALAPDYADAWFNLGTIALRTGAARTALDALERAAATQPDAAKTWAALGHAHRQLGNTAQAREAYLRGLRCDPRHSGSHHGLALALRQQGELSEALRHMDLCIAIAPADAELQLSCGNILADLGRNEAAVSAYRRAVELRPDFLEAHQALNNALWLQGDVAQYLDSYRSALARVPAAIELHVDLAHRLILAGRPAQAQRHLSEQIAKGIASASMHHALGRALASQGRTSEAYRHVQHALDSDPQPRFRLDAARLCLIGNDAAAALSHLDAVLEATPNDQVAIAYRGVCWRLLGDAREPALNDYSRFVQTFDLPAPSGYSSIDAFNQDLARMLAQLHRTQCAPADQSLRGGTQTLEDLFATQLPIVEALRTAFEAAIRDYVRALPADTQHPLLRRNHGAFRFAGSWSVRLARAGYHVNHVHSQGWISSCYYVRVPHIAADTQLQAGWLQLGETDLKLAHGERIGRMLQPREGTLVLFPSYLFHGTTPFDSDEERITVAFDVVPA
ncbi:MAG TPA: tetratricopeptide repeat protein [Steroidobacteraceae bacterium]|nr:tetratricopeptide repeat protein [Steroidobacteraceae bacterium]